MGVSIGHISTSFTSVQRGPVALNRLQGGLNVSDSVPSNDAPEPIQQTATPLSGPGAALAALSQTVESAREVLPTFDEIRIRSQLNAATQRRELEERQAQIAEATVILEDVPAVTPTEVELVEEPVQTSEPLSVPNLENNPTEVFEAPEAADVPEPVRPEPPVAPDVQANTPQITEPFDILV